MEVLVCSEQGPGASIILQFLGILVAFIRSGQNTGQLKHHP